MTEISLFWKMTQIHITAGTKLAFTKNKNQKLSPIVIISYMLFVTCHVQLDDNQVHSFQYTVLIVTFYLIVNT